VGERWGGKVGGRVERERKKRRSNFCVSNRGGALIDEKRLSYKIRRPSISDMKSE
jgi:hypothetical protein